jgi:hypothetical protein
MTTVQQIPLYLFMLGDSPVARVITIPLMILATIIGWRGHNSRRTRMLAVTIGSLAYWLAITQTPIFVG